MVSNPEPGYLIGKVYARVLGPRSLLFIHDNVAPLSSTGMHYTVAHSFGYNLIKAKFHYAIQLANQLVRELVCDLIASC